LIQRFRRESKSLGERLNGTFMKRNIASLLTILAFAPAAWAGPLVSGQSLADPPADHSVLFEPSTTLAPMRRQASGYFHTFDDWLPFEGRLTWHRRLVPLRLEEWESLAEGEVFRAEWEPALSIEFSRSSLTFFRKGVRLNSTATPLAVAVNYRRPDFGTNSNLDVHENLFKLKTVFLEFSLSFE
jgi:hypothetical protein